MRGGRRGNRGAQRRIERERGKTEGRNAGGVPR